MRSGAFMRRLLAFFSLVAVSTESYIRFYDAFTTKIAVCPVLPLAYQRPIRFTPAIHPDAQTDYSSSSCRSSSLFCRACTLYNVPYASRRIPCLGASSQTDCNYRTHARKNVIQVYNTAQLGAPTIKNSQSTARAHMHTHACQLPIVI